jgi:hypothetical protein
MWIFYWIDKDGCFQRLGQSFESQWKAKEEGERLGLRGYAVPS